MQIRKKNSKHKDITQTWNQPVAASLLLGLVIYCGTSLRVQAGDEPLPLSAIVTPCPEVSNGVKRITIRGGTKYASKGEVFGFDQEYLFADRCQKLEITFIIEEPVRHLFMTNNLNPMFMIEAVGPAQKTRSFITPDEPSIIHFHCHIPSHKTMGMSGTIIVGFGTAQISQ